jgi:glutamine synthetase
MLMAMTDGILYAKDKTCEALLKELSKEPGEPAEYLDRERAYRTEKDVFDDFTDEERERYFGVAPETVYENIKAFHLYPEKVDVLKRDDVFSEKIIDSYAAGLLYKWYTEIDHRMIPSFISEIRSCRKFHKDGVFLDDRANWDRVERLKIALMKNTDKSKGIFNYMREALEKEDYDVLSDTQKVMYEKISELRQAYKEYKDNLMDIC